MRASRLFVDEELAPGQSLVLAEDRAHYVKNVLRCKSGYQLTLFNGRDGFDYPSILRIQGRQVEAEIISSKEKHTDAQQPITLLQAVGRSEHMDYLVQKSTELGVHTLYFFNSERSQFPIKKDRLKKKLRHWRAIAISACEQCNRNHIPTIRFFTNLEEADHSEPAANRLLLDFDGESLGALLPEFDRELPFQLLTGPEGGLTRDEIGLAISAGFTACVFGPRIMRMETAATSILAVIQHHFGDLN
jgi:16S rRNA (uracil1498-N3)-methyltransferase